MNRDEKQNAVAKLKNIFTNAKMVVVVRQKGLNVAEVSELRKRMRNADASFQVTKNKLVKRALADTNMQGLAQHFVGPTAISWSNDMLASAKVTAEFAKENDKLDVIVGATQENMLDKKSLQQLASLPPLEVLRAKILGLIQTPAQQIARILSEPSSKIVRVIKQRQKMLGEKNQ